MKPPLPRLIAALILSLVGVSAAAQVLPPALTKAFSPTSIADGGTTTLTFTVSNPAGSPAVSVGFVDTLPTGLRIAAFPNKGGTCSGAAAATTATAGGTTITVSALSVPAGASLCTVTVDVTNAPGQINGDCSGSPVNFTNSSGNLTLTNIADAIVPSCLVVTAPTFAKAFSTASIADGGTATLTFTLSNPAGNGALSNVGFVDALPGGLRIAAVPNVGGTCSNAAAATTASAGGTTITTTALNVPAGASSCTVTVDVTNVPGQINNDCSGSPANFTNASGNVTLTNVVDAIVPACLVVAGVVVAAAAGVPVPTLSDIVLLLLGLLVLALGLRAARRA